MIVHPGWPFKYPRRWESPRSGQVLILVSVGANAKQTGRISSSLAQAGYDSDFGALVNHEVAFAGIRLAMVWTLIVTTIMFRGASRSASA